MQIAKMQCNILICQKNMQIQYILLLEKIHLFYFPLSPSFTFISTDRFKFNRLKTYEVYDGINLLYMVNEEKK